ncbi:hypothetical protein [Sphingobacterium sp. IITKGP-BTPF85]|uniref:hypothetical protein n=1 Tax=Sphingobacterium sp. IITKGP-BTPF85 TaxID=1338009 RepID=UPI000389F3ED|nr:hypothetical protein [Sphingobacterium sp. IITKGP-BTPF85]KKX47376.1 hypothetical protein L950_0226915 [Sphingobacterium sp. IITKGP-BTPF85]
MPYKKVLLVFLMLFTISHYQVSAQKKEKIEYKFGKIQPEEFSIMPSGADSAASAIKLFDIGNCYFELSPASKSFVYVYERHVRYKIINKNGYDYANHTIGLYKSNSQSKETLDNMSAATYNMVDGVMKTDKIDKDSKFTEEVNKNVIQKNYIT